MTEPGMHPRVLSSMVTKETQVHSMSSHMRERPPLLGELGDNFVEEVLTEVG